MRRRLQILLMAGVVSMAVASVVVGVSEESWGQSITEVTLVNIEFEGSKIWVPGPVVVQKGDTVRINAINNVKSEPPVHGLAIEAYGIHAIVHMGKPEVIEFTADKAGIFPITCHLHPPHVGTQLVVLDQSPGR